MCFPRLYDLAENKGVMVREMARRGWVVGEAPLGVGR